ncbi:MAG: MFS transporter [Meiothermus sp.]|nr:MFS transporter [Meiothermus sp.]
MTLARRLTLGTAFALMMSGIVGASVGAALPFWRADFGIEGEISWYFNLVFVGGLLGTLVGSRMRVRQPWLPLSVGLQVVGFLLIALAPQFTVVLAGGLLAGFAVMVVNVNANAVALELNAGNLTVLSRVNAAFGLGAVVAPLLVVGLPWRTAYLLFALLALVTVALLWGSPRAQTQEAPPARGMGFRLLTFLLLAVLAYVSVEIIVSSFTGVYLQTLGYSVGTLGVLLSLYWVGLTVGRLVLGPFIAPDPLRRLLILHVSAVAVGLCYFSSATVWLFPLLGFLVAPTFPTLYTFTRNQIGPFAIPYIFYMGTTGSNLIPAGFARIPDPLIGWGVVGALVFMAAGLGLLIWRAEKHAGKEEREESKEKA